MLPASVANQKSQKRTSLKRKTKNLGKPATVERSTLNFVRQFDLKFKFRRKKLINRLLKGTMSIKKNWLKIIVNGFSLQKSLPSFRHVEMFNKFEKKDFFFIIFNQILYIFVTTINI